MKRKFIWQEADFYGASSFFFKKQSYPLSYKASWTHGLHDGFSQNYDISWLVHPDEINMPLHLVNNIDACEYLSKLGKDSKPVGMPIIYAKSIEPTKKINRLFVPTHLISGDQSDYFKEWKKIIKKYNCDSICLSKNDFIAFKKNNFDFGVSKIFRGAHPGDISSLNRIKSIFSSTKEILTNGFGSHLIYGSYCGANVIIVDEFEENYSKEKNYNREVAFFKKERSKERFSQIKNNTGSLDSFYKSVWFSNSFVEKKEFSDEMIGVRHKTSIEKIRNYLSPLSKKQEITLFLTQILKRIKYD